MANSGCAASTAWGHGETGPPDIRKVAFVDITSSQNIKDARELRYYLFFAMKSASRRRPRTSIEPSGPQVTLILHGSHQINFLRRGEYTSLPQSTAHLFTTSPK